MCSATSEFAAGSIVRARGREWVVQSDSMSDLLLLRPLGGSQHEITGILPELEPVETAHFALPTAEDLGDYRSSRLLRDAIRLGFRSSAGPFRSFARLSVEPRPYQLVPLLMALRQDPVRLLIADDVGIGKTIEAGLIARELLDRGEVQRMAVLCPPHLAEQWQEELQDKFNLPAELVLASTARQLERQCRPGQSIFQRFPVVVVSIDYIKSDRRRDEFVRLCPELVIVDEAHTCAQNTGQGGSMRHQRYQVLRRLTDKEGQHLILVTATPHSGKEDAFRSLLSLLNPHFRDLPEDLSGDHNRRNREQLARHLVQRRRANIRHYLKADTPFPERLDTKETYALSPAYSDLFDEVLAYARERVQDPGQSTLHQRIRWWSALALLRSLASSPAAAIATLKTRAATLESNSADEADLLGRGMVLDDSEETGETLDVAPGADDTEGTTASPESKRLLDLAAKAEALKGASDSKLQKVIRMVKALLKDGQQPILFCRFIPTAEYLGEQLREALKKEKSLAVEVVTGMLAPSEREARVESMGQAEKRVLVCTDCLSEGINLQRWFDTVIHYDLAWSPTRHEQREGRVDRYGQPCKEVKVVTYYCTDNQIDSIIIRVLLEKHQKIRKDLGISIPVPVEAGQVLDALFEGLIKQPGEQTGLIPGLMEQVEEELFRHWENAAEREKRSRSLFAQESIRTDEVERELTAMQLALGSGVQLGQFVRDAVQGLKGTVAPLQGAWELDLREAPHPLLDRLPASQLVARFELPVSKTETYLHRTHPFVEQLAGYLVDTALDPLQKSPARRAAVIRTKAVQKRTTLLLVRFRYHLLTRKGNQRDTLLAEDGQLLAFEGAPDKAEWLSAEAAEALLNALPSSNLLPQMAQQGLQRIIDGFEALWPELERLAHEHGEALLQAHRRVREEAKTVAATGVEPRLPPDVLGVYIFLPE